MYSSGWDWDVVLAAGGERERRAPLRVAANGHAGATRQWENRGIDRTGRGLGRFLYFALSSLNLQSERWMYRANLGRTIVLLALVLVAASGCVRRRLNVRSNPPGALVYVDNQQIGTTPCSVDFTYYGTREIRLIKPGYETLTLNQPIPTPWYQIPPLDFVSENLVPAKIRDSRTVTYNMSPAIVVPSQELVDRANQLRQESQQFPVTPAAATVVP